jgi:protein-disulfide isomerase
MMRPASLLATILTAFVLLAGCGDTSTAPDVDEGKILANLRLEIPQVRDADSLRIDSLRKSSLDGFYRAQLVVNNQNRVLVMIREDESEVLLLAGPPLDVGRSAEQMQASQQQESEARADVLQRASEGMPALGPADAPVTLIEFSDFQCPYCARATTLVDQLRERYPDRLRVVFMHFPLSSHEWARPAAMAAQCAARQDEEAFWRLHDFYFSNQDALTPGNVMEKSESILAETAVNVDDWKTCATDRTSDVHRSVARKVNASLEAGKEAGVTGTPSFFVNGEKVQGARTVDAFARKIEAAGGD